MINAFTVIMALASAANAHMVMKTPTPALSPNNSPLDASGSDFPCKIPGGSGTIPDTNKNVMYIGASNPLSFTGSAVHGGGSCQVSLAKGNTVSKDTKWMVIHSIEGGCPATGPPSGNFASDANANDAATFQFTVPDHPDLGPGTYTLAWTWHNKIGNREMYMNCAYVDLQAAKKKRYMPAMPISKRSDAPLPAMFVANIGNGCTVAEGTDVKYPDPGSSLEVTAGASLSPPQGNCGASGAQPANPSGSSSGSSSAAASPSAVASNSVQPFVPSGSASRPTGAPTGFGGNPSATSAPGAQRTQSAGGSFATVSAGGNGGAGSAQSSAAAVPTAAPTAAPVPSGSVVSSASAAQPTAAAPTSGSAPSPAVPGSGSATGSCTNGYWLCAADGKSFKRCSNGVWTVDMQMAAGTSCVPDSGSAGSATLTFAGAIGTHSKRDIRAHIARRAHGFHGSFLS